MKLNWVDRENIWAILLVSVTAIVIGLLAARFDFVSWSTLEAISVLGVFFLALLPALRGYYIKSFDPFEPVYLFSLITIISFVAIPVFLLTQGNIVITGVSYRDEVLGAIILSGLGLIGFYAGYYPVMRAGRGQVNQTVSDWIQQPLFERNVRKWAVVGLFFSFFIFTLWFELTNVPLAALNALTGDSYYREALLLAETNVLYFYTVRVSWPALLLLAYPARGRSKAYKTLIVLLWFLVLILYIVSGNRGVTFRLLLATAVYFYLIRGRRPALRTILISLVMLALVAGSLVVVRSRKYDVELQDLNLTTISKAIEDDLTEVGAATGMMILLRVFPERTGWVYFKVFEELLYTPIPRVLWPDKPIIRGVQGLAEQYVPHSHSPPIFGPFYAGFGLPGVVISMIIFGGVSAWIYSAWQRRSEVPIFQVLLAVWLGLLWELYHRGGTSWITVNIIYAIGPILVVALLAKVNLSSAKRKELSEARLPARTSQIV